MMSMVWNISVGRLGLAAWLCSLPALVHLLNSQTWESGKRSLDFLATTGKHWCCQHSSHTKSKIQQLLGRKLTVSQPKPAHSHRARATEFSSFSLFCLLRDTAGRISEMTVQLAVFKKLFC